MSKRKDMSQKVTYSEPFRRVKTGLPLSDLSFHTNYYDNFSRMVDLTDKNEMAH
jgi:hypothetical protein